MMTLRHLSHPTLPRFGSRNMAMATYLIFRKERLAERPTERASRRRSPKKNSDINFFRGKMSDFRKKMAEFCRKRAKNTAFARENTRFHAKMGVFRAEKRFSQNFRGKKRPRHVESVSESVRRASTM